MADPAALSIIIPHLNQPDFLGKCLASLASQMPENHRIEIIVCDNGSAALPTSIVAGWDNVRLIEERTPGPGPARNAGIAQSSAPLLAFIDADCVAAPGWIDAILTTFADPEAQVFGGDVRVRYKSPGRPTFLEPYEAVFAYRNEEYIASGYSGTGNLAMRREVFDIVGGFAGIGVAEDHDWGLRAKAEGIVTRYVPEMIIYHPARTSFSELTRKWDRHIAHDFAIRKGPAGKAGFAAKMLALLVSPIAEIPRIARSERIGGFWDRMLAFACLCRIRAYRAGRMAALLLGFGRKGADDWNRQT